MATSSWGVPGRGPATAWFCDTNQRSREMGQQETFSGGQRPARAITGTLFARRTEARSAYHPMIELQDITKTYGTKTAVNRLNLSIEQGELFAFLGPNGAGK